MRGHPAESYTDKNGIHHLFVIEYKNGWGSTTFHGGGHELKPCVFTSAKLYLTELAAGNTMKVLSKNYPQHNFKIKRAFLAKEGKYHG